ncbi:MAG: LrgB family protein [Alphaproteobacteria bacterium]|nr:LrgB family protein [Alphaproteobacteria bacterium]
MNAGLWVYLSASPLLWLTGTLAAWALAQRVFEWGGKNPLLNPVLLCMLMIVPVLKLSGIDYQTYFNGAQFIHFLLGPATVALGIPLYQRLPTVRANLGPMLVALAVGSVAAIGSTLLIGRMLGLPPLVIASIAPKSATTAVAMAISSSLHGDPGLTAAVVIVTGICGSIIVTPLMNAMRVRDYSARGFAVGLASHGIGTARAFAVNADAGLFAGLGMGLNAAMTALIIHLMI